MHVMDENELSYRELIKVDLQVMFHSPLQEVSYYNFPKIADALKELGFELNVLNTREFNVAAPILPVDPAFGSILATLPGDTITVRLQQDVFRLSWDLAIGRAYPGFEALSQLFASALQAVAEALSAPIPYRAVNIAYKSFLPHFGPEWLKAVVIPDSFPAVLSDAADMHQVLIRWRGKNTLDRSFGIDKVEVSRIDDQGQVIPKEGMLLTMVSGEIVKDVQALDWRSAFDAVHNDATQFLHDAIRPEVVKQWAS